MSLKNDIEALFRRATDLAVQHYLSSKALNRFPHPKNVLKEARFAQGQVLDGEFRRRLEVQNYPHCLANLCKGAINYSSGHVDPQAVKEEHTKIRSRKNGSTNLE